MKSNDLLIKDFLNYNDKIKHLSGNTLKFCDEKLRLFDRYIDKKFDDVNREDVINFLSPYAQSSQLNILLLIKRFYKFINKLDEYDKPPKFLRSIKLKKPKIDKVKYRERIISEELYRLLIDNATSPKHKAMLETLWNFGVRQDEWRNMNISDVVYDGKRTKITVRKSKTESRDVVYDGRSDYLLTYIENYYPSELKKDKNSPLWIGRDNNRYGYSCLNSYFRNFCKKLGISHIKPHDFRHTYITNHRRNGTPDTHIENMAGLVQGSGMLKVYDATNTKDYEEWLDKKGKEYKPTFELLEKQKKTLEEKHQKEIDSLKKNNVKLKKEFDELFDYVTNTMYDLMKDK